MKAIVHQEFGSPDVMEFTEAEKPMPRDNEVLIEVMASSLNAADWHMLQADPFLIRLMGEGLLRPKHQILGGDVAGRVETIGRNVKQFRPGDEVFGHTSTCGWGAFAEYVSVPEHLLALKPTNSSFEEAAAVPLAGITALQGLRDHGRMKPGQKVLIYGASGGVGTFAVQIAKSFGTEVTAVCSTSKMEMVHSIGADHVIDYTQEDFTTNGELYDLILAVNGYRSIFDYKRSLRPEGTYVMAGGTYAQMFQCLLLGPWISMAGSRKMRSASLKSNQKDLMFMKELLETGKVRPVIDRQYSLQEVPDAMRYLIEGHARGKVVIKVDH
ncbi:MAG: NAD(P)-dependent alcohol dehydrogenase [Acidobacteriota bacterium]